MKNPGFKSGFYVVVQRLQLLWSWEGELERPLWQLKRLYEVNAMKRMDDKRKPVLDELDQP